MPRAIIRCPRCGAAVTNYAIGCAVCGTNIESVRRAQARRRALPAATMPRLDDDGLRFLIALLLALAAPLFGLALSLYFAWEAHTEGRSTVRNVMLVLVLLAAVPLVAGYSLWGGLLTAF
jgi:hypothetical protein